MREDEGKEVDDVPEELKPLEKLLRDRSERSLNKQALEHSDQMHHLRQQFISKLDALPEVCCPVSSRVNF